SGSQVTIPVSVTVGTTVFRQVNPLSFTMPFGGSNPLPQILSVMSTSESSGTNLTFDANFYTGKGGAWLAVSNHGFDCFATPGAVTVSVSASTLAAGTYTGEIVLFQTTSHDVGMTIPVTLTVAASNAKYFDSMPGELAFSMPTNGAGVPSQSFQVRGGKGA